MALKAHRVYFSSVMTVTIYLCNYPLRARSTALHNRQTPSDWFVHLLESLEFFKCLLPCCRIKTPIIIFLTWITPEITQPLIGFLFFAFWKKKKKKAWKASPTLSRQIKDSLYAVLAIKDVHGVFALVLLSGLIDLKPQLLSCDPGLNSLWGGDLWVSEGEKEQRSVDSGSFHREGRSEENDEEQNI